MATNIASGTIVSQCAYNGGWSAYDGDRKYAGHNSSHSFPYILQFQTPEFTGVSEELHIVFGTVIGYGSSVTLCCALCTSDANRDSYVGAIGDVSDSYQISTGTMSFSGLNSQVQSYDLYIDTAILESNTTYYVYLWAYDSTPVYVQTWETNNHSITLSYNAGLAYVDNGSGWDAYQVYVDNGSGWDLYIPYVDNGSGWDILA